MLFLKILAHAYIDLPISRDALEDVPGDYLGIAPLCVGLICLCAVGTHTASSKGEQVRCSKRCSTISGFYTERWGTSTASTFTFTTAPPGFITISSVLLVLLHTEAIGF